MLVVFQFFKRRSNFVQFLDNLVNRQIACGNCLIFLRVYLVSPPLRQGFEARQFLSDSYFGLELDPFNNIGREKKRMSSNDPKTLL